MKLVELAEHGRLPDWAIRIGIRQLLSRRRKQAQSDGVESSRNRFAAFVERLRRSPLAVSAEQANHQHYEVPADFFRLVLGPQLKYSCCLFPPEVASLPDAEERMLRLTCERAEISDGMEVLELGCGWGALTLWIAEKLPSCRITALSNSHSQRKFIQSQCRDRSLTNVRLLTTDICEFETDQSFDRVVSLEMFEHLRNYELLFRRIAGWLRPDGKLFTHIFCHRDTPYFFETAGAADWMGRHFFTGGMMPADNLPLYFQNDLALRSHWRVAGGHYARTCECWLENLDRSRGEITAIFERLVGKPQAPVAVQRWRMFFMACAELFSYRGGDEWFVAHYLFDNRSAPRQTERLSAAHQADRSRVPC